MKRMTLLFVLLVVSFTLFAVWSVGEPITDDYSWTDNNGENHSIHELTAAGKAIVMFWGGTG